jgi:hypothetical protein
MAALMRPRQPRIRRPLYRAVAILGAMLVAFVSISAVGAQSPSLEDKLKATYLYKFIPYIEWPAGAFPSSSSAITLCVVGNDPFGEILDDAIKSSPPVDKRTVTVRRLVASDRTPTAGCHILFLAASTTSSAADIIDAVRGTPVLTVTDRAASSTAGSVINFVLKDNRVRFEVDDAAASENGLVLSSKLLSIASQVRGRR